MKRFAMPCLMLALLTGCNHPNQNRYGYQDVGQNSVVKFGTVIAHRQVDITGQNTGVGAMAGAAGGALGGAYVGSGGGSLGAMIAGALIAGVAGQMAEQAIADHKGIEYTITEEDGQTVTVVQNKADGEEVFKKGSRVMVQTNGQYNRVLPADDMPTTIKRPKKIKVTD